MLTAAANTAVRAVIGSYIDSEERLAIWEFWPDVSDEEHDATDEWECTHVAVAFAAFARSRGLDATVIRTDPDVAPGLHAWTRIRIEDGTIDVDFTARQYHNLEGSEWVLDEPWPVIWDSDPAAHTHPIVADFGAATTD